jgi:hypothetical protein
MCFTPTASGPAGVAHTGVATLKIAGFEAGALAYLARQELSHFFGHPGGRAAVPECAHRGRL